MPKVSDAHRASRREQVLDAALRCFSQRGFQRTSMADIIRESGLSAGAIYLQFPGKQQIAAAVAERVLSHRLGDIAERMAHPPLPAPAELIRLLTDGFREDSVDARLLLQVWGESVHDDEMSGFVDVVFARVRAAIEGYLAQWRREAHGATADDAVAWARLMTPVFMGLVQGCVVQSTLVPAFDRDAYLAGVATLFA